MFNVFIIAMESSTGRQLSLELSEKGYACSIASGDEEVTTDRIAEEAPDLVLVESRSHTQIMALTRKIKREKNLPVIALVEREMLSSADGHLDVVDDFVVKPYNPVELHLRAERLVRKKRGAESGELLTCGDLVIDLARYEVVVDNQPVILTFKEYELLKFLVSNAGRVHTREALLNKVWGYDYYGGDRTVDVHITRLRNKIEGSSRIFIETVRNIGYRLRVNT